jgi:hypothetical protein
MPRQPEERIYQNLNQIMIFFKIQISIRMKALQDAALNKLDSNTK